MLNIRPAKFEDIKAIRDLLADDDFGKTREDLSEEGLEKYRRAFRAIEKDPGNTLYIAVQNDRVVGTFQITWIPYLSRGGNLRALTEAVRVASDLRGQGIGKEMMEFAIAEARHRGCGLMQLTTDKRREAAHRFYTQLGFEPSHTGMKLKL